MTNPVGTVNLAFSRAALASVLTDTVVITAPVTSRDVRNAVLEDWTTPTTVATVLGRVMNARPSEAREVADKNYNGAAFAIGVPVGTSVLNSYRMTVGGKTYRVIRAIPEPTDVLYNRVLVYLPV